MTETTALTARDIRANVNLIQEVMKEVMKKDVHYGVIPGCKKPSLYKPGSEKILSTFRLAVDPQVEDLSTEDCARFRVIARVTHIGSGQFVGSGIGECSSDEDKYRWRKAVCEEEFNETPEDRRREKWFKAYEKPAYQVKQVRTNVADVANTILKMAKKRAQIDATLTATAASDVFDQDIEDLPEELRPEHSESARPEIKPPQERQAPAPESKPQIKAVDIVTLAQAKSGEKMNVFAYAQKSEHKQFPKKDKTGVVDITTYSISDLPENPTVLLDIKVWGALEPCKKGQAIVFENVVVGEYKGKPDYLAERIIKNV